MFDVKPEVKILIGLYLHLSTSAWSRSSLNLCEHRVQIWKQLRSLLHFLGTFRIRHFKHTVIDNGKKSRAIDRTIKNLINFKVRWVFVKKLDSGAVKSFLEAQAYFISSWLHFSTLFFKSSGCSRIDIKITVANSDLFSI